MVEPRLPLAGRFTFAGLLRSSVGPRRWLASDGSGGRFIAVALEAGRLSTLEAAKGVKHRHLAAVIDVVREVDPQALPEGVVIPPAGGVAVAEYLPGTTLKTQLQAGALNASKAVAWTLRLAESVHVLHQAGGVHGAISLRSVLGAPEGRKIAPVLSQLLAQPVGSFCPPERLRGGVETAADDVWALHAVLFAMLTREAPFQGARRDVLLKGMLAGRPAPLSRFGIDEPALDELLGRGLMGQKRLRVAELSELISSLDGWERDRTVMPAKRAAPPPAASRGLADIVGGAALVAPRDDGIVIDDDALPSDEGREMGTVAPPPSPSRPKASEFGAPAGQPLSVASTLALGSGARGSVRPPSRRISVNPFERKKQVWPLLLAAASISGGGVYLAVAPSAAPPAPSAVAARPAPPAPVKSAKKRQSAAEDRDACVAAHFDASALASATSFEFVCSDRDFRDLTTSLHRMVAPPAPAAGTGGGATVSAPGATSAPSASADTLRVAALRDAGLGWYELPATAIIRRSCCPAAPPLTLPESAGWCEQLQSAVRRVADDSSKSMDLAPAARAFDKAVSCLFANKIARPYAYDKPPTDANRRAFQQFLGRAAVSDARR
jgi:serine/threonine protein kinase